VFTAKLNVSNALRAKAAPMVVARRGMSQESAALGPGMSDEIEPEQVGETEQSMGCCGAQKGSDNRVAARSLRLSASMR
jgi:hypothetical protein